MAIIILDPVSGKPVIINLPPSEEQSLRGHRDADRSAAPDRRSHQSETRAVA
ncbi:hypothetical protein [Methylobacterium soli]|uniref:hypothetical protein n=1 Tax=Methylobacterium soli TaxID=553447 RepID=UPI00177CED95|nr:hypothetical protein [Methylobacterium soli]GJE43232.1 hypothetical protein AEGHOMDF_2411 [Methylobacterium soli]